MPERSFETVVLRRSDSGESDRRVTLFTRELGKIDAIAKGARKSASRLAAACEPFTHARFQIAEGKARRFVTQVELLSNVHNLRSDYDRLAAAYAFAEVLDLASPYESESPDGFAMLLEALGGFSNHDRPLVVLAWAQANLLALEGLWPDWLATESQGEVAFVSPHLGGPISREMAETTHDALQVHRISLVGLSRIVELSHPPPNMRHVEDALRVLFTFWRYALDSPLPANQTLVRGLASGRVH